jgi:hypothetical protein
MARRTTAIGFRGALGSSIQPSAFFGFKPGISGEDGAPVDRPPVRSESVRTVSLSSTRAIRASADSASASPWWSGLPTSSISPSFARSTTSLIASLASSSAALSLLAGCSGQHFDVGLQHVGHRNWRAWVRAVAMATVHAVDEHAGLQIGYPGSEAGDLLTLPFQFQLGFEGGHDSTRGGATYVPATCCRRISGVAST